MPFPKRDAAPEKCTQGDRPVAVRLEEGDPLRQAFEALLDSVTAIVVAHAVATWLAHETALRSFPTAAAARRSQYPMICLMIAYTVTSLWILAEPIVEAPR